MWIHRRHQSIPHPPSQRGQEPPDARLDVVLAVVMAQRGGEGEEMGRQGMDADDDEEDGGGEGAVEEGCWYRRRLCLILIIIVIIRR